MVYVGCVVVWAAAVNFGQFVDDAAADAVSADVLGLAVDTAAVVLAAVNV